MSILKIKDQNGEFVDVPVISGKSATIKVGEVKLLEPTSEPTIENVGTEYCKNECNGCVREKRRSSC